MATYYPTVSNELDAFSSPYCMSQQLDSYQESPCPPVDVAYHDQVSSNTSFLELLSGNVKQIDESLMLSNAKDHDFDGQPKIQNQELSLSLGTQIPSSMDLSAMHYDHKNQVSFELENSEYLSFDLAGGVHNTIEAASINTPQCSMRPEQMQYNPDLYDSYEPYKIAGKVMISKYLKPSQQLLDEIVSLREPLRQMKLTKHRNFNKLGVDGSDENDFKTSDPSSNKMSSGPHESTTSCSGTLSPSEQQDLKGKLTKLSSMLDEVDRRYREYRQRLQGVESTLEMEAGFGAAKPYTSLAIHTISRHFRTLRDAIDRQIQVTRQSLGEPEDSIESRGLRRLRYVDKQLRQQRTLQQLGMTQHTWRPQRGLPEASVSILRAWLFEHFLNPYPKESEKIKLARETGLTRSQIANWFINARVRLWKPMIEDIYKEEFGDSDAKDDPSASGYETKDRQRIMSFMDGPSGHNNQSCDSNPELINNIEMNRYSSAFVFQNDNNGAQISNVNDATASSLGTDQGADRGVDLVDDFRFGGTNLLSDFVIP